MSDQVKLQVLLEFETEGAEASAKNMREWQRGVDEVARAGGMSVEEQNKLSRAISGTSSTARQAAASLPTLRYAMYDVAQTAGVLSASIAAVGSAAILASASFETSFTKVERTSGVVGDQATRLRDELLQLSREIPQSFGDIASLASRGAQLGIATNQIEEFTEVVAQFVATSDTVTLDQAVEAFGRISNLMGDTNFSRIGSAITLVGVNAAATEAQIVKTTQELAPFATAVGMSSDEVIGLAAALGSLGQPPERARSAFLTLQRVMDTAVATGSSSLHEFAKLLGQTTDQVAELWKQDPSQFIASFVSSLGSVEDLTTAFASLGINERRAVQVFQALAADARNAEGGLSVLNRALADSSQGYAENTEMLRQYGLILDDLSSKWQIFKNSIQEIAAAAGDALAPMAKVILDVTTAVTQLIARLTATSGGKIFAGTAAAIGALLFVVTSLVGVLALGVASMAAMQTALTHVTRAAGGSLLSFNALSASATRLAVSVGVSSNAIRAFRVALASTGIGLAVVALGSLAAAFIETGTSAGSARQKTERFFGGLSGLGDAMREDTAALEDGAGYVRMFTAELPNQTSKTEEAERAAAGFAATLGDVTEASKGATAEAQVAALAWGAVSQEYLKNQLRMSEGFKKAVSDENFVNYWLEIGADVGEAIDAAADKGREGVQDYFLGLEEAAEVGRTRLRSEMGGSTLFIDGETFSMTDDMLNQIIEGFSGVGEAAQFAANEAAIFGVSAQGAADDTNDLDQEIRNVTDSLFEAENWILGAENAIYNLGVAMGENAGEFNYFSEAGRASMSALISVMDALVSQSNGNTDAVIADFIALRDALILAGMEGSQGVDLVTDAIARLGGGNRAIRSSGRDFTNLFSGWSAGAERAATSQARANRAVRDTGSAAKEARKEVRTLLDYAGDLSSVWDRAFDIRFSGQSTLDKITGSFLDMEEASRASQRRIRELTGEINTLEADIDIQEYYLSIAIEYDDALRAAAIEADLSKKRAELANKTEDLQSEQDKASKSLEGNTQGAIDNRAAILDLVSAYQDHIGALARSGMSSEDLAKETERLRQDFIRQGTQLGYSRKDLEKYAVSFNDVRFAIDKVPRNITVKASTNPAQQAFNEMKAAADRANSAINSLRSNAGRAIPTPTVRTNYDDYGIRRLKDDLSWLSNLHISARTSIQAIHDGRELGWGYASGGYTGQGGKYEPAGIVHRGEYVIPKHMVNQSTGMPYNDALGRLMTGIPGYANGGPVARVATPQGITTVALTAGTIQAIAQATEKNLVLNGRIIAESSSNFYSNETTVGAY